MQTIESTTDLKQTQISKRFHEIPDFLVIGAGKCGTTSLNNYLKQHPEIFIPVIKEPNFFGYELMSQEVLANDPQEFHHYNLSVTKVDDYLDLFKNARPDQMKGETSNTYMYHSDAAERIKYYNPNMKLIAVLRQPADRLYSRYLHLARENRVPTKTFEDCLDQTSVWWKRNDLIQEGFYFQHLSKFFGLFPAENIRVFLYEDINKDTDGTLKAIYDFLNVNSDFEADTKTRYNESGFIKNKLLNKIYGQNGLLINTVKSIAPNLSKKLKGNSFIQAKFNELRSSNLVKPKFDASLRHKLTNDVYRNDILSLQELIKRDLTHWLLPKKETT